VVKEALALVVQACGDLERNSACYGYIALDADPKEGLDAQSLQDFVFEKPGDVVAIRDLGALKLSQYDEEKGTWGVAALRAQANLPGTGPGQAVTMLLFGDTEVNDAGTDGTMKAFYLRTGLGKPGCAEMPRNGVLLQSPKDGQKVEMTANGVQLKIGSTVFLFADAPEGEANPQLWIHTLEGEVEVTSGGVTEIVSEGQQACVPLKDEDQDNPDLDQDGPPCKPEPLDEEETQSLPIDTVIELYAQHIAYDVSTMPTATPVESATPTATATNTLRPIVRVPRPTRTPTPTATSTDAPPPPPPPPPATATLTPTLSSSVTLTPSLTASVTASPTPSVTASPTDTPTPTFTPLPTDTFTPVPTDTPLPTDTPTFTPLPTDTYTPVPTNTPPPPPTNTPTDTATPPILSCSIGSFTASPPTATLGQSVTLSWTTIGTANSATIFEAVTGMPIPVSTSGTLDITFGVNEGFSETWTLQVECGDLSIVSAVTTIDPEVGE
jgi:hypothetical protein